VFVVEADVAPAAYSGCVGWFDRVAAAAFDVCGEGAGEVKVISINATKVS
jgi:hypothetical protein